MSIDLKQICKDPIASFIPLNVNQPVIALGDIHGDFNSLKRTLQRIKLINNSNMWIGNNTILVQLGDQIDSKRDRDIDDRPDDLPILEFFTKLHMQAIKHGGAVYSLLGNHELMNVLGDFRYVSTNNKKYPVLDWIANLNCDEQLVSVPKDPTKIREWAFKPGNPLANFLACTRVGVLIVGEILFVHAGVVPELASKYGVKDINNIVRLWLQNKYKDHFSTNQEKNDIIDGNDFSPFWNRFFGQIPSDKPNSSLECKEFDKVMKFWNVNKMIVGHTPQINKGINSVCNDRIWRVDTGQSYAFDPYIDKSYDSERKKVLRIIKKSGGNYVTNII